MFDAQSFLEGLYRPASASGPPPDPDLGPDDLPGDLRIEFEERAALMEYEGGLSRERAEALALAEVVKRWQSQTARRDGPQSED